LIVQGELRGCKYLRPEWFGRSWRQNLDFRRFAIPGNDGSAKHWRQWHHEQEGVITSTYDVKSISVEEVEEDEVLFETTEP
jgi:hypothetical protein